MKAKILIVGFLILFVMQGKAQDPLQRKVIKATTYMALDTLKSLHGKLNVYGNRVEWLGDPINPQDAVNLRTYQDSLYRHWYLQNGANYERVESNDTIPTTNFYSFMPNDTVQALSGTSVAWDVSRGVHGIITLTGNTVITLSNVTKAFSGNLTVINRSGDPDTLSFDGYTNKISPAIYMATDTVITSGNSKIDVFSWWFDGTRLFWNGTNDYN